MSVLSEQLNAEQRQAVEHVLGPLLVLAPVGTGKTTVLAHRAVHAIHSGIAPSQILCLSFTNRAAREMRERVVGLLGGRAGEIPVRTFHGFCTHVLRHEADAAGVPADFTICDEEDSKDILLSLAAGFGVKADATNRLGDVLYRLAERSKVALVGSTGKPAGPTGPEELLHALAEEADLPGAAALAKLDAPSLLAEYDRALAAAGSLDFNDLIVKVDRLFARDADCLRKWQRLFPWVQVDEVQDTNLPEYHILARLALESRNLAFFGDIDQTIYEWRGSQPFRTLGEFKRRFDPVREVALKRNYRSSRSILQACESFIKAYARAVTKALEGGADESGKKVFLHEEDTPRDEARWVASVIARLAAEGNAGPVAVLARTNYTAAALSEVFAEEGVDHHLVDRVRFFRRPEVKDALAHVRCLLNPLDGHSLLRVLRRPPKEIDARTIDAVRGLPTEVGLRLVDFVSPGTFEYLDPFGLLLRRFEENHVVLFDTETTGLDVTRDDVVELAAVKVGRHGLSGSFHALVKPSRPLGDSSKVHGITEEMIAAEGREPGEVFRDFLAFIDGCVLAGHNVGYDVNIVRGQMRRLDLPWPERVCYYDTLDLSRRFFKLHSYTLANVCKELRLAAEPTHRAADDVRATWQLLTRLLPCLLNGRRHRTRLVAEHSAAFGRLNRCLDEWRRLAERERPVALLEAVLDRSGLRDYWGRQGQGERRLENLEELARLFRAYDDPSLSPRESLLNLADLAVLGNEADRHVGEGKVLLLTVHQAKGLEFDTVFIAGATDREFPSLRSQREGRLDEEYRLFYVAMTRARRRLYISHPRRDGNDRKQAPSRFLDSIPEHLRCDL